MRVRAKVICSPVRRMSTPAASLSFAVAGACC